LGPIPGFFFSGFPFFFQLILLHRPEFQALYLVRLL